jgi:hypothetical protein
MLSVAPEDAEGFLGEPHTGARISGGGPWERPEPYPVWGLRSGATGQAAWIRARLVYSHEYRVRMQGATQRVASPVVPVSQPVLEVVR